MASKYDDIQKALIEEQGKRVEAIGNAIRLLEEYHDTLVDIASSAEANKYARALANQALTNE